MVTTDWVSKIDQPFALAKACRELGVSKPMAEILLSRTSIENAKLLLNAPEKLYEKEKKIYGMEHVAECLAQCSDAKIYVFADYDVDGLTSGFILGDFLRNTGYDVTVHYPNREDGYGITLDWARRVIQDNLKEERPVVVVTVDNGITANEVVEYLVNNGAGVFIVDHHQPGAELPPADGICDAWIDQKYGTHLCAAAVVWKLVVEIARFQGTFSEGDLDSLAEWYVPYAMLGTISDVMPAEDENRAIIQAGLRVINTNGLRSINTLMQLEGISRLKTKDVAWTIGPELNACSRMGDIDAAVRLLNCDTLDDENSEADCSVMAKEAGRGVLLLNRKRKNATDAAIKDIEEKYDFSLDPVCFVDGTDYELGIIGILAGKVADTYKRPAIVYTREEGTDIAGASCRSTDSANILDLVNFEAAKGNAVGAAGHAAACGAQILVSKIPDFLSDVIELIESSEVVVETEEDHSVQIDTAISPDDMTLAIRNEINSFGYTSQDIPVIALMNVEVEAIPWTTSGGKRHVIFKMKSKDGDKFAVAWNGYDNYKALGSPKRMNFSGSLDNGSFCKYFKGAKINDWDTILIVDRMDAA